MLKNLKINDIITTPFVATKPWVLTSFQNDDLVLIEETEEIPVAEEFIDYEGGDELPILNRECSIALEQQTLDEVLYEEGEKKSGIFDPDSDPKNNTGTYKRLVYNQIKNCFYNDWKNPTKMFGMENIDFQLSETKKFLTDKFRLFNVSPNFFGEKMLENSIIVVDNSLDDNFQIVDDGKGNIIAKENLFSKIQEIRHLSNLVEKIESNTRCDFLYTDIESRQTRSYISGGFYSPTNCQPW